MSTRQTDTRTTEQKIVDWADELIAAHQLANRPDATEADHRAFGSSFARLARGWGHARSAGLIDEDSPAYLAGEEALALRISGG